MLLAIRTFDDGLQVDTLDDASFTALGCSEWLRVVAITCDLPIFWVLLWRVFEVISEVSL